MKKVLLLVFAFLSISVNLFSVEPEKEVIAILDLSINEVNENEMAVLLDFIFSSLVNTNSYTVIDRNQRDEVLKEQRFSLSGVSSNETAVEIGELLSAQYIVTGSLGKVGQRYIINLKLIDVESTETIQSISEKYTTFDDILDDTDRLAIFLTESLDREMQSLKQNDLGMLDLTLFDQTNSLIKDGLTANYEMVRERSRLLSPAEKKALYDRNSRNALKGAIVNTLPGFGVGSYLNHNKTAGVSLMVSDIIAASLIFTGGVIGYFNNEDWKEEHSEYWVEDSDGGDDWNGDRGDFIDENGNVIVNPDFKFYDTAFQSGLILFGLTRIAGIVIPSVFTSKYNEKLSDSLNLYSEGNKEKVSVNMQILPAISPLNPTLVGVYTGIGLQW